MHSQESKVSLSGTKLREKLQRNEDIHSGFMRREVVEYLLKNSKALFV